MLKEPDNVCVSSKQKKEKIEEISVINCSYAVAREDKRKFRSTDEKNEPFRILVNKTFGPLLRGQPHSPKLNHCVLTILT